MKTPAYKIIESIVALQAYSEPILSCVVNGNEFVITLCNTHHLVDLSIVEIGGSPYTVKKVENGTTLTFNGTSCPVATTVEISAPNFFSGTVKAIESELSTIRDGRKKTTMVYLFQVLKETRSRNPASALDRTVQLRMFFMEDDAVKGLITDERYTNYINAMDNCAEDFIDLCESSPLIGPIEENDYTIIPHAKFGYYNENGHRKNLFSMPLSGIELMINVPLNKEACKTCN